jgi:16S rRNA (uracil1498-N3)-methyltransferase
MRHQPHLWIERPWAEASLAVSDATSRHLSRVLRFSGGEAVNYTDGVGGLGIGEWSGTAIERGTESKVERPPVLVTLAVGSPKSKDRQRSIVEKAQELGVQRLVWLSTEYGQGRPASDQKMSAWARGSLEQSRGAWLLDIQRDVLLSSLAEPIVLDVDGVQSLASINVSSAVTLAIGSEGGFSATELASAGVTAFLPTNILRTDTAAIVAVAILVGR